MEETTTLTPDVVTFLRDLLAVRDADMARPQGPEGLTGR